MQRFRAALLALGLVALLAGMALGVLATQAVEQRDHDLGLAGASRVTAVDDYADRARAVTLLASHSAAFANFYQAPGSRMSRIEGRSGEPDLMPRVITALTDLEKLFPDSIASASFIDRSGAENARVVGTSRDEARRAGRRPLRRGVLRPRLPAALRQGLPVGALPLGVDGRLGHRQRRQGQHRARCLAGDRELRDHPGEHPAGRLQRQPVPAGARRRPARRPGRRRLHAPPGRQRAAGPARTTTACAGCRPRGTASCAPATTCATWCATPAATATWPRPGPWSSRPRRGRVRGAARSPPARWVSPGPGCCCCSCRWSATSGTAARCTGPPGGTSSPACSTGARPASAPRRCWPASAGSR